MKNIFVCLLVAVVTSCKAQKEITLVPQPVNIKKGVGEFVIDSKTVILVNNQSEKNMAELLNQFLKTEFRMTIRVKEKAASEKKHIIFAGIHTESEYPEEGYNLTVENNKIEIAASTEKGKFYGLQTLIQLLAKAKSKTTKPKLSVPKLTIDDYPRFAYRGMHLDVGRHFFPVSFIKKYIDYLAAYKYNTFHWHLTEDQGWRIEIKKYPALTSVGGWRNGTIIGRYPGKGNDDKYYGGYYTQEEIKEVVAYAAARHIDVIPEIEMPGHSSAAIAAYPWLSCFPEKPTEIPANMISKKSMEEQKKGRVKLVQETWGVFDDVFCAGKDSTFTFLQQVIDEVTALFPSKYFHIGGDECPKTHWQKCPACQQRMMQENLKDEHELQSWFVQRVEKYLNSKGKTLIGWDEILEGGLAPNAVVMSWRGEKGGIEAARQKHNVIMTPGNPVYFDHTQSKNEDSVTIGGYNPIENVYAYEPIPKELSAEEGKYVLGAQANMWTEYMKYPEKIEYMMFPRMIALSEVLWSPKEKRDWQDFERRLPYIFERLEKEKINYSRAYYDLKATVLPTPDHNGVLFKAESKNKAGWIQWMPHRFSSAILDYTKPVLIKDSVDEMAFYLLGKNNKWLSSVKQSFYVNKATGKKITLAVPADKKYPGDGPFTLVNGVQNEKGLARSSEFLGFNGIDLDATIDLGKDMDVSTVTLHVLKQTGSWIYLPRQVEVTFIPFIDTTIITKHPPLETITVDVDTEANLDRIEIKKEKFCRYIQIRAKNYGIIPAGKPGAGNPAWLFVDEIEVF